jgi:hypothetical protein
VQGWRGDDEEVTNGRIEARVFISDPDGHRIEMLAISASERDHEHQGARALGR